MSDDVEQLKSRVEKLEQTVETLTLRLDQNLTKEQMARDVQHKPK